jgi:hypothetical protein
MGTVTSVAPPIATTEKVALKEKLKWICKNVNCGRRRHFGRVD